jgi:phosphoribosyl-dephospho-CoA transferase
MNKAPSAAVSSVAPAELKRHQLVWLTEAVWAQAQRQAEDAQAIEIFGHWREHKLPVMVTRQRADVAPDQVCLGLPAPLQWSRRKLALSATLNGLLAKAACPTLAQIAQAQPWHEAALELHTALAHCGVQATVYGSYAWQHLTGLAYLRPSSDIDLCLNVVQFDQVAPVLQVLAQTQLPQRLDGEIIFANTHAVAWRELQQLLSGQVTEVLLKNTDSVRLVNQDHLLSLCPSTP